MEYAEILGNPLFVPLLVAILTILTTAYFNYWLRKWQYRREYVISNVEKTYIPLLAEIQDNLKSFNRFLETPYDLTFDFEKMESIKKSGLFEFIRNHDKKLGDGLILFYENIYPRFQKLVELEQETRHQILEIWTSHISRLISDETARRCSKTFVNYLYNDGLYLMLLNGKLSEGCAIWDSRVHKMTEEFNLYANNRQAEKGKVKVLSNVKFPTFAPSSQELEILGELSRPMMESLLAYHNQTKELVETEVVNGFIPLMQKYIIDPLAG